MTSGRALSRGISIVASMDDGNILNTGNIFDIGEDAWKRNKSVHLAPRGAARPWICRGAEGPLLVILPDQRQVRDFVADAEAMSLFADSVFDLPEMLLTEDESQSDAIKAGRGDVLERFRHRGGVLAATPASLLAPFSIGGELFNFAVGESVGRSRFLDWLAQNGYERSDLVWSPGQYAARGSVVDVFSPADSFPIRVEFFDEDVESIRFFLPETQKSLRTLSSCSVQSLTSRTDSDLYKFFPSEMRVVFFDPQGLDTNAENSTWLWNTLDRDRQNAVPWQRWEDLCSYLSNFLRIRVTQDVKNSIIRLSVRALPLFRGRLRDVEAYCSALAKDGFEIKVFSESESNLDWAQACGFKTVRGILSEGFADWSARYAAVTDLELSGVFAARRSVRNMAPAEWGGALLPDQWVVHDDYGVAIYAGTQSVRTAEGEQEYMVLRFAEESRLLIPITQIHKITPWTPIAGQEPVLDSLKSSHWKKSSAKAKAAAAAAASELVKIYAEREITKGFSFAANRDLMRELENGFTYVETDDQIKAIKAVEEDMESPVPMDRLIVGDVGFGKTEVAIRAAGKAVFSGKQVALMAPTTLLAQQHYETFSARFGNLPVSVEVLSRFVPLSEQKRILQDIACGKTDIIIGTHRLLGEDVTFKDLGLVIIDEEHRFGVMHKEKLKKAAPEVDVLMLSATPIPRSLSLSLSGLRDISILDTPPKRRLPVVTVVRPWSEPLLKSAVLREKNRGGQVFFVHNRIEDIQERATMLRRLFPKLRVAVAHSGTPEAQLEKTMTRFSQGEIDILVCTTIVESGLDIPMANTLIVDDAHELGLAQMYQLRGRVGRREEQAYAFFFYPKEAHLSVQASERLEAIAGLDELGAGYRLAQMDLQIRGGGDLIGTAQHGHASRIGYQKYCEILAEEIAKIKGVSRPNVDVEIGFPAVIPRDYLPQENLRVTLYRRLLKVESTKEAAALKEETGDRFGRIPASLDFLFDLAYVRAAAPDLSITKIVCGRDETVIRGTPDGGWGKLNLPAPWMRRLDGYLGPGGADGMKTLAEYIRRNCLENLVK